MNRREGMTAGQPPKYENYEDGLYKVVGISDKMEKNYEVYSVLTVIQH